MTTEPLFALWVYLAGTPLAGLTLTLAMYALGWWCYARTNMHPLANPVLITVVLIIVVLTLTRTSYQTYFDGAQFVHFLLGPAVVGLAVPLVREWPHVRRLAWPIAASLLVGSTVALASAVGIGWLLGATPVTLASLAPKSVTAPIAMGIADKLGGLPALAAVFAVSTGILGAALGKYVLDAHWGSPHTASAPHARSRSMRTPARLRAWHSRCTQCWRRSSFRWGIGCCERVESAMLHWESPQGTSYTLSCTGMYKVPDER
jgi:putative effector of murein hydrolase